MDAVGVEDGTDIEVALGKRVVIDMEITPSSEVVMVGAGTPSPSSSPSLSSSSPSPSSPSGFRARFGGYRRFVPLADKYDIFFYDILNNKSVQTLSMDGVSRIPLLGVILYLSSTG